MSRHKETVDPVRGQRLKQILMNEGITQNQLSKMISLSQQQISLIVRGHTSLTPRVAKKVITVFPNYRIEWLLNFEEEKTYYNPNELQMLKKYIEMHVEFAFNQYFAQKEIKRR